jgi:MFS transporter, DHA1 family, inner membrane transport protein
VPLLDADLSDEVRERLPLLTIGRTIGNAVYRLVVPFLGVIARSLGVPLSTMGTAVSAGDFTGLLAPLIGRRLDRSRRGPAMTLGMAIIALGSVGAALSPGPWAIGAAFVTVAFGKQFYDPALSAWASERVGYDRRARVFGLIELSWAGSMLVVVPLLGLVVAGPGWRWAYASMGAAAAVMAVVVHRTVRDDAPHAAAASARVRFRLTRVTLSGVVGFGLLMTAAHTGFVVFGAWLGDAFGFSPAVIGLAAVLLGLMELAATTSTIRYTDRIGKRNAVSAGAALMVPAALALGLAGQRAWAGLPLFALFVLGFEFALVSGLPLIVELQPDAPAAGLGLAIGAGTIGRGAMSLVSTRLYDAHGIGASGVAAAAFATAALAVFGVGLRGQTRLR